MIQLRFDVKALLLEFRLVPVPNDRGCAASPSNEHVLELSRGWDRFVAKLRQLHERQRQRVHLLQLDEHLLKDIGVSPEQARQEGEKPPWRD